MTPSKRKIDAVRRCWRRRGLRFDPIDGFAGNRDVTVCHAQAKACLDLLGLSPMKRRREEIPFIQSRWRGGLEDRQEPLKNHMQVFSRRDVEMLESRRC